MPTDCTQICLTAEITYDKKTGIINNGVGNEIQVDYTYSSDQFIKIGDTSMESSTITTEAVIYTYGIEVTKYDEDKVLEANSSFTLLDSAYSELYFINVSGVYYQAEEDDEGASAVVTTDEDGKLTIYGLDEGTYYLSGTMTTTIELADSEITGYLDYDENDDNGIYEISIYEGSGFTLPTTGGIGTTIFVATGVVLVVAGLSMIVISSKKKKNNA